MSQPASPKDPTRNYLHLQNMHLADLPLLLRLPVEVEARFSELRKLCADTEALPPPCPALWEIRRLGVPTDPQEKSTGSVISLLAAAHRPFVLGLDGRKDGTAVLLAGAMNTDCKALQELFSCVCGFASLSPAPEEPVHFSESWCICQDQRQELDQIELPVDQNSLIPWMDSLARAAAGNSCAVRLHFTPIPEKQLLDSLSQLERCLTELGTWQKKTIQLNAGTNQSSSRKDEHAAIPKKVATMFVGEEARTEVDPERYDLGTSESLEWSDQTLNRYLEQLQARYRRLDWMRRSGGWYLQCSVRAETAVQRVLLESILSSVFESQGFSSRWSLRSHSDSQEPQPLCAPVPTNRLDYFACLPEQEFPGLELCPMHRFQVNLPQEPQGISLGNLIWNRAPTRIPLTIPTREMNRHVFVCGMTGSGKTNTVCSLLSSLEEELPFLVIEPVKGEYRSLKALRPELQVFTMEAGSPDQMQMNPFWFPKGGKLQYHIDTLRAVIASAFELNAAMPNILEQCLTRVYGKLGWNIASSQNIFAGRLPENRLYPTFSMLCGEIQEYLDRADFGPELKGNYKGALLSRLQTFTAGTKGMLLNCPVTPPVADWIQNGTSCIVELDALADDADKAIVMGVLLSQYFACLKLHPNTGKGLRHLLVLEEAHHLFKNSDSANPSEGDTSRQHLVESLSNLLAEIRAYGEGVIIVDQSPTSISPQVIKNTAVKIIHRTDHEDDLRVLQNTLLLQEEDREAPASLACGEALIRYGAMHGPVHARMRLCQTKEDSTIRTQTWNPGADSRNLLDLLSADESIAREIHRSCVRFLNHFLFDTPASWIPAMKQLIQHIRDIAAGRGYDWRTLERFAQEDWEVILRTSLDTCLTRRYPGQYLMRQQLSMALERFLSLQLHRKEGIHPGEQNLILTYLVREILPAIAYSCDHSVNDEVRKICRGFSPVSRKCLSGFLHEMMRTTARKLEQDKHEDAVTVLETLGALSPAEGLRVLCPEAFFFTHDLPGRDLTTQLWNGYKICLARDLEDALPEKN